jgi:hypothetical protein
MVEKPKETEVSNGMLSSFSFYLFGLSLPSSSANGRLNARPLPGGLHHMTAQSLCAVSREEAASSRSLSSRV